MSSKRGVLVSLVVMLAISLVFLGLLSNNVKAAETLLANYTDAMTNVDISNIPACGQNKWQLYVYAGGNAGEPNDYFGYFYQPGPGTATTAWTTAGGVGTKELSDVYLKFVAPATPCTFPAGTITLRYNGGSTTTIYYNEEVNVANSYPIFRRVSSDGSTYTSDGFCNLTKPSASYNPRTISVPASWQVYYKENSGSWDFWNGTRNLSRARVLLNHTSGNYILFDNITTSSTIDYNLSQALMINDTIIGIDENYWTPWKKNLCFDESLNNMIIKTPTRGTKLAKYNSSNGALLNASVAVSAIPIDIWTIPGALGFSYYIAGMRSELNIFDNPDPAMKNNIAAFYANYTNITSHALIGGSNCSIWFSDWGNWTNMTNATSSGLYEFNRTFTSNGLFYWNVSCNSSDGNFDNLMADSNITVVYPRLESTFFIPASDISVNKKAIFNITAGVTCRDYACGNISAALDPFESEVKGAGKTVGEKVNIVSIKETKDQPPWTNLAIFLTLCLTFGILIIISKLNHKEKIIMLVLLSIFSFGFIMVQEPTLTGNVIYDSATHLVNATPGATPFFTLNNNTYNRTHYACLGDLSVGASCNITWQVNATGSATSYTFFTIFNATNFILINETNRRSITINALCGDNVCEGGETCSSCANDCGTCPAPQNAASGVTSCSPEWICDSWSECSDGKQIRACKDNNCAGMFGGRPEEERTCENLALSESGEGETENNYGSNENTKDIGGSFENGQDNSITNNENINQTTGEEPTVEQPRLTGFSINREEVFAKGFGKISYLILIAIITAIIVSFYILFHDKKVERN
ncbi:MAG: hypothetical protein Q8O89_05165 [Nanoarchaeota archaeon]|nr:hypothetical protein [Nanoarchaeota archaeon]